MATKSLIASLKFPSIINVSNGMFPATFSVGLVPGTLGSNPNVQISFDYIPFDLMIGLTGIDLDTFNDATPNYGASTYNVSGSWQPGEYTISAIRLWDGVVFQTYSTADLIAAGLPSHFTVVNTNAPPTPTAHLVVDKNGLIDGTQAVFTGTAEAGSKVVLTSKDGNGYTYQLGNTMADADGNWKLVSGNLSDGKYQQVIATAFDSHGYASAYSTPLNFIVEHSPLAPEIRIAKGSDNVVSNAHPFVFGHTSSKNATVTLYDAGKKIAVVKADEDGWWGYSLAQSAGSSHSLTATVTNQYGVTSASSTQLAYTAASASLSHSVSFAVDTIVNNTAQALDTAKLEKALLAVSGLLSNLVDGSQSIGLKVTVGELATNVLATAGAAFQAPSPGSNQMPQLSRAELNLSPNFAKAMNDSDALRSFDVAVLAHEMLHVLGINYGKDFASHAITIGANKYFNGAYAKAISGGPVLLSADGAHVMDPHDVIYPSVGNNDYFQSSNSSAPFSALDLAILKDLGYQNIDTIVSADGHTYLAGNGKAGHDTITGIAGTDTVFFNAQSATYSIQTNDKGFSVTDLAGDDGTVKLVGIERILFADHAVALDTGVGQIGGEVYRMYQAAFNRTPDSSGLGFWIDQMEKGLSLNAMAAWFKNSPEFIRLYGDNLTDTAYVTQLYANVLHRAPESSGLEFWLDNIGQGVSRERVLAFFSESPENVASLVGVLQNGYAYTPELA